MTVTGFFHGGISVSDMDTALRFYRDGLGLEIAWDRNLDAPYLKEVLGLEFDHIRIVYLHITGGGYVELLEYVGVDRRSGATLPCDYGSGHLCLYVDDVDAMHTRLVSLGFQARSNAPVAITSGPNAGARSCYMLDADGYAVELFQPPRR